MAQMQKKLKITSSDSTCRSSDQDDSPENHRNISLSLFNELEALPAFEWRRITAENLLLDYAIVFPRAVAWKIFDTLEQELEYFTGDLARVKVFGKWHEIPRQQATYGDAGLTYTYSGITTPARPWPPALGAVRDTVQRATGYAYNFVLVNRYKDGKDKMGEHKDDEKELDPSVPIASVSLGQARPFYFVHQDARSKKRSIPKVSLQLEHGSVLLMRAPTNRHWYHALPPRASAPHTRINLTFRAVKLI